MFEASRAVHHRRRSARSQSLPWRPEETDGGLSLQELCFTGGHQYTGTRGRANKSDKQRALDCLDRLDEYDGHEIAKVAPSDPYGRREEAQLENGGVPKAAESYLKAEDATDDMEGIQAAERDGHYEETARN